MKPRAPLIVGGSFICAIALALPARVYARASTHALARVAVTAPSNYARGEADLAAKKYREAEAAFRAAIKQKDHLAESYAGVGYAAAFLGDYKTSFEAYKQAHALAPRNNDYTYKTAFTALYFGDFHAAITYIDIFIKAEPKNAAGYHLRFLADGRLLRTKDEARDAGKVVALQPNYAPAWNDWGIALANIKQFKQAIAAFNHAISLDPKNYFYYENRAQTENYNHEPVRALADYKRARALDKDPATRKQLDDVISALEKQLHK